METVQGRGAAILPLVFKGRTPVGVPGVGSSYIYSVNHPGLVLRLTFHH